MDLRYGAVLYRDLGDTYVTRRHAFTDDLDYGYDLDYEDCYCYDYCICYDYC